MLIMIIVIVIVITVIVAVVVVATIIIIEEEMDAFSCPLLAGQPVEMLVDGEAPGIKRMLHYM